MTGSRAKSAEQNCQIEQRATSQRREAVRPKHSTHDVRNGEDSSRLAKHHNEPMRNFGESSNPFGQSFDHFAALIGEHSQTWFTLFGGGDHFSVIPQDAIGRGTESRPQVGTSFEIDEH